EVKSGASGVGFTDVNPGIITSFVSLFPTSGTSFYRGDSVIDPKNNYTGKNAGSRAFGVSYAINMGDLLNYIYNAVTDDRANLSSEGKTLKSGLLSKPHGTRAQKAEAVGGVLKLGPEAANLEATVNKFNAVKILYKLKGTNRGIMVYPDGTGDAAGFGYNVTAGGTYDNGYYASANTLVEKDTTLTGKTFASSDKEIQKAGLWVKNNAKVTLIDSTILSRSAQNEKYRWGGGAGLLVTGKDTVVRMINTTGRINVNGTGGTMSGAAFTGMGGTLYYQNAQVYSGGQHTSNSCWGGILIYDNSNIFGGGRTFSTDHFGGNLVYKASISDKRSGGMGGAYVLDETSSLLSVNSYFAGGGQFEINGMAQAYYLNSKIDNSAAFTFQNNTSMSTDVGTVTLVNTEVNLSGSTLANALKGGRGILTLVDSNVTAAKTGNVFSVYGKNLFMHGSLKVNLTNSKIPAGNVFVAQGDTLVINTDARSSVDLTLDASKPTTWNNSMFKLSYTYNNLGNIIVNGMETGLDENGRLLNEANASMTPGSMGAYDVVYSIGGSKITYKNLPVGVGKDNKVFSFKDMSPDDWYYYYVAYGVDKGIISGTSATAFSPDASVTRGMIITMLWRMADKPLMRTSAGYTDLKEEWYRDAANWAAANKIVDSAAGGRFGPSDAITRSELVTLIYRFNYYKGLVGNEQDASILKPYTDAGTLTGDALAAMRWAVGEELIKGRTATTLVPQGKVTRVEVTSILIRYTRFIKS
ncbi:MAG: S-layer homology domain-containing protein, partial [Clostridiales bacterium]|nr:S-layer homology domain-containing protein [Clostridiales bacterium]